MNMTLDDLFAGARQLAPSEQDVLIYRILAERMQQSVQDAAVETNGQYVEDAPRRSPTREELLKELETLRATPVRPGESLMGKYANPDQPEISDAALRAQLHADGTEWEQELDEFDPKHD